MGVLNLLFALSRWLTLPGHRDKDEIQNHHCHPCYALRRTPLAMLAIQNLSWDSGKWIYAQGEQPQTANRCSCKAGYLGQQ